jgi:hypothetical protein
MLCLIGSSARNRMKGLRRCGEQRTLGEDYRHGRKRCAGYGYCFSAVKARGI